MKTIKCSPVPTGLKVNGKLLWRYLVQHGGTIRESTFFQKLALLCGLNPIMAKAVFDLAFEQIGEELKNGYRVELPQLSAFLSLAGKVDSTSPEDRKAASIVPVVHLVAKDPLKSCCQGDDFAVELVSEHATVQIYYVVDGISKENCVLTNGISVVVSLVGTGFYMPDTSDPTVGVWLEDKDGVIRATAAVDESTVTTLSVTFSEIDLPAGDGYRICVASRNGLDPEKYGVTVARRKVTVVDAPAAEGGE